MCEAEDRLKNKLESLRVFKKLLVNAEKTTQREYDNTTDIIKKAAWQGKNDIVRYLSDYMDMVDL
jgi:hypothetical protein